MERMDIKLGNSSAYDEVIKGSLPERGDLSLITKDMAMESGRAGAMLTFTVRLPDGTDATAQATVPVRLLIMALSTLRGRYTDDGALRPRGGG